MARNGLAERELGWGLLPLLSVDAPLHACRALLFAVHRPIFLTVATVIASERSICAAGLASLPHLSGLPASTSGFTLVFLLITLILALDGLPGQVANCQGSFISSR